MFMCGIRKDQLNIGMKEYSQIKDINGVLLYNQAAKALRLRKFSAAEK